MVHFFIVVITVTISFIWRASLNDHLEADPTVQVHPSLGKSVLLH